jgi:hypothetical protein
MSSLLRVCADGGRPRSTVSPLSRRGSIPASGRPCGSLRPASSWPCRRVIAKKTPLPIFTLGSRGVHPGFSAQFENVLNKEDRGSGPRYAATISIRPQTTSAPSSDRGCAVACRGGSHFSAGFRARTIDELENLLGLDLRGQPGADSIDGGVMSSSQTLSPVGPEAIVHLLVAACLGSHV